MTPKRQVAHRILLSLYAGSIVGVAYFEPQSLTYRMLHGTGGLPAHVCMMALLCFALLTLADTLINDLFPPRFAFRTGLRLRQRLWLVMGVTFAGLAFVSVHAAGAYGAAVVYVLHAAWCAVVSFLDLHFEQQGLCRHRRHTDVGGERHA